jgi:outer membrane lipoprotein-sorting protein
LGKRACEITAKTFSGLACGLAILTLAGCAVNRTTRISKVAIPPPPRDASAQELIANIDTQAAAVNTMTATVDMEPEAGSLYSGVIKQYHDVKGFVLAQRPSLIRIVGQAPVVRTDIFDMTSDGQQFRLYVPSKGKFFVGRTDMVTNGRNSLENLRPQHIMEALMLPPVDPQTEEPVLEEGTDQTGKKVYVINIVSAGRSPQLKRKIWFDRSDLSIVRVQFYAEKGRYLEDVRYLFYQNFQGVRYPSRIVINRPGEDYTLSLTIEKATFNQPIGASKFVLKKPAGAELVDLGAEKKPGAPHGQ